MAYGAYINLNMRNGTVRHVSYDSNDESPFQALERVYRNGDENGSDFMCYEVESITFNDYGL